MIRKVKKRKRSVKKRNWVFGTSSSRRKMS